MSNIQSGNILLEYKHSITSCSEGWDFCICSSMICKSTTGKEKNFPVTSAVTEQTRCQTTASRSRSTNFCFHFRPHLLAMPKVPTAKVPECPSASLFVLKHGAKRVLIQRPKSFKVSLLDRDAVLSPHKSPAFS